MSLERAILAAGICVACAAIFGCQTAGPQAATTIGPDSHMGALAESPAVNDASELPLQQGADAAPADDRRSPLSRLLGRLTAPKAIPLPRTDLHADDEDEPVAEMEIAGEPATFDGF
ncbi:MAG: hypothetical protein KY476_07735 [Planctomycetes bacterium]|nr:hypothetical protein [Planctomycetota bacterium]